MIKRMIRSLALLLAMSGGAAQAGNISTYYLFDGDSSRVWAINNGVVTQTFTSFYHAYPAAIRNTIWLGERDDQGAREYNLDGTPTGNTAAGGHAFTQLLDGTAAANGLNYGIECCGATNSVTVANSDWSSQAVAFNLDTEGRGIAYNLGNNSLYVSDTSYTVHQYSLAGAELNSFDFDSLQLAGLAYEAASNSMWGWSRDTHELVNFSNTGLLLSRTFVDGVDGNPFGGEMALAEPNRNVPEPASLALIGLGLAGIASLRRKQA